MRISGTFLRTERKSGDFTNDQGEKINYDYSLMHVLDDVAVRKVRLPKDVHTVPFEKGDAVEVDVEVADNIKITCSESAYRAAVAA